jgi:hypothetical protein
MKARQIITRILLPGLALWLILYACNTPSIPMPPPGPEFVTFVEAEEPDYYKFILDSNQFVPPGADVTVMNRTEYLWVGGAAEADGSFESQPFFGHIGDMIQLIFTKGDEGGTTCYILSLEPDPVVEDPRCGS